MPAAPEHRRSTQRRPHTRQHAIRRVRRRRRRIAPSSLARSLSLLERQPDAPGVLGRSIFEEHGQRRRGVTPRPAFHLASRHAPASPAVLVHRIPMLHHVHGAAHHDRARRRHLPRHQRRRGLAPRRTARTTRPLHLPRRARPHLPPPPSRSTQRAPPPGRADGAGRRLQRLPQRPKRHRHATAARSHPSPSWSADAARAPRMIESRWPDPATADLLPRRSGIRAPRPIRDGRSAHRW
jgi:hypothetical protein